MDVFNYVMVLVSVIAGLAVTQMLQGVTQLAQEAGRVKIYWVQLVWALANFFWILSWWWFEFNLARQTWTFRLFLFVVIYAVIIYLRCAVIFPLAIERIEDMRAYYYSRRAPFFGLILLQVAVDLIDTLLKGRSHAAAMGPLYWIGMPLMAALAAVAIKTRNAIFHAGYALIALAYGVTVSLLLLNNVQ
jgi:hypothetical protein